MCHNGRTLAYMLEDKVALPDTDSLQGGGIATAVPELEFPVVGVGASAGGLEALSLLLRAMPVDTGMGFVIVQHLSPTRASGLTEILARTTEMPVCEVGEACGELAVEPNHVYVIPPGQDMIIVGRRLKLLPQERRLPHRGIDQFFCSLAQDCKHKAIGIVLSGFAHDGTMGLEAIKAEGGITFAQDDSARQDSMPRSAEASGCVDFVLPPAGIAAEIGHMARHPHLALERQAALVDAAQARITQTMFRGTGVDFTNYKSSTMQRRITRRMLLHKVETVPDYEAYLQRVPAEVEALFQDLLIGVTSFFRDPAAYEALARQVFAKLLAGRSIQAPIRVWTLGCSTGQEAYSLAMLYTECAEAAGSHVPLQIFATDLNNASVLKARAGFYPKTIAEDMSAARLKRFFMEEEGGYRICKSIRERCVFSRHNVLSDPPFSRVDFITCRNLMIYMEPVLQQQIMPLLHYALKPGGFLWLGNSETAGTSRTLFELEDARHKIYSRRAASTPLGTHFWPRFSESSGNPFPPAAAGPRDLASPALHKEAERILLTKYAPPGVVISSAMDVVQFRGDTGAYLAPAAGVATLNLLKMLREGMLYGVRAAILRATETGRAAREEGVRVKCEGGFRDLAVDVIPIRTGTAKEHGFLVLFDEGPAAVAAGEARASRALSSDDNVARLTQELVATREHLQAIIEQQEAVNAELQATNEEAQSANEEMQSINEELETSKEEIQSSNEELATVNDELNDRNVELNRLNESLRLARDYAESIVSSVRSPLVILDAGLRVKTANTAFYETFFVTPAKTEGRLIYDLGNGQWNIPLLRTVLEELLPQEEWIHDFEVRHIFEHIGLRIMVLNARRLTQAGENEPLIVLSIEDITTRKQIEAVLRQNEALFTRLIDQAPGGVFLVNEQLRVHQANPRARPLFGEIRTVIGRELTEVMNTLWGAEVGGEVVDLFRHTLETGESYTSEDFSRLREDLKVQQSYEWEIQRVILPDGQYGVVCYITDTTERQLLEDTLVARAGELARADRSKDEFLAMLAHELRNPLAPLRNAAEILQTSDASEAERSQAQRVVGRQIENMSRMIDDLLDVSRITEGKIELRREMVGLESILTAATSVVRSSFAARQQELTVTLPKDALFMNADATRLEQVFTNLLGNACKYSGKGCHIWLSAERDGGSDSALSEVVIRVRDNGVGITAELLPHVFDLFVQASRTLDRAHGGLGIGLSLVSRLVKLHGGRVEALSEGLGHGSEFVVHLPILREAPPPLPSAPPMIVATEVPRRILIVDDNTDAARTLAILQRRRGHDTRTAFTGPDAVTAAAEFLPELILLDIGLPGMDGFEVARRLRAMPALSGSFIAAMSGYGSDEDRAEAKAAGFDEYLVKPVDTARLRSWLREGLVRKTAKSSS